MSDRGGRDFAPAWGRADANRIASDPGKQELDGNYMTTPDPTLRPDPRPEDNDRALRPQMLADFIGQAEA
ncbi:MAG: hypothetical protein P8X76_16170, partial [Maritimibacter sp.]